MKIMLALRPCSPGLARRLGADEALARALGAKAHPAVGFLFPRFFDASGPVLPRLLALAEGEPVSFLRDVQCTATELEACSHFEAVCRSTVGQTRADSKATMAAYHQETLQPTASRWAVRLPQRIFLSKTLAGGALSHVDEWTGEYVLGGDLAQALRASGLTGFELRPVLHFKTGEGHDGGHHLVARELLPAALEDATTFETFDDGPRQPSTPRRYGLLSYAEGALESSPDLARTAEPWGAWRTPAWIVRQRARAWFEAQQVKGWKFQPVLAAGSRLHAEHTQRWQDVLGRLRGAGASIVA
ncbi:hypothetical protein H8N03_09975 [Ramlibacter sp. USB13]|uniref:Uncharacterized protein n=1 Tax=Ramlibacter cellulosilyticus TaxID=2764187 RepID=A0A923MP61_9BURK|nr:hypothetical protein [Ramlibacter cellulosilyticus]MBC5783272.1 hypothetical protein [Ramlibacter cellulosilyticus]